MVKMWLKMCVKEGKMKRDPEEYVKEIVNGYREVVHVGRSRFS